MNSSSSIRPFKETREHSYHRRSFFHDYCSPFIYHIILKKEKKCEKFGEVIGNARISPGEPGCANIKESPLGRIIAKEIIHLPYASPIIKLHQFCVMPDHVHILLQVLYRSDKPLDFHIDGLREKIAYKYSKLQNKEITHTEIFEIGFCDKPLYDDRSLDGWYAYIRENPHRRAMIIQYPFFFQRKRNLEIGGKEYEAYGNLFLFRNPDKIAVKMSSKFSENVRKDKIKNYLDNAFSGTILVSPFIHEDEKLIRKMAEEKGSKLILIVINELGENFKPCKHEFYLCSQGNLLIISMGYPQKTGISKKICNEMNALAQLIASSC